MIFDNLYLGEERIMTNVYKTLEFNVIIDQLKNYCFTEQAKDNLLSLLHIYQR